ncbi:site-specific integrase [Streptococcus suis]|uniref:site-specific integrase n=1 Tax=Streptococcus suis TaxID=1307 RepID=UPI0009437212|nr:site-specific integrase [Streptococcus suis]WNF73856.1 site-specific integrase [Streptococcus suis]HEM2534725.1 site-specific integrase [Streptococcus suis]HEM2559240.1 site-specific integrase [Streptococcus suis]
MSISYSQRGKKNLWTYRIFDKTGKQLASKGGFKTKTEAKQEAMPLESKLINGLNIDKSITLYQLWKKWYELHIVPQSKMQSTLNKHLKRGKLIEEYFIDTPLRNIKSSQYQEFINNYAKTNCRDNVSRLNSEVKKILDFARQDKIDFHDFTTGVNITGKPPQKTKEERYINSKSDYIKLLDYLFKKADYKESVIPYLLYIQLKTGLRFGEVLELTWDCVIWETKEIYTYRRYDSVNQKWTKAKTPESIRYIPIDDDTVKILFRIQKQQHQYILSNPDKMLFVNLIHGIPSNKACNKHLQSILEHLDIFPHNMTCTGNRHTYASILLSEDIDIWAIAKNMGHKDIKQITETYGHLIKEKAELENNKVRQALLKLKTI